MRQLGFKIRVSLHHKGFFQSFNFVQTLSLLLSDSVMCLFFYLMDLSNVMLCLLLTWLLKIDKGKLQLSNCGLFMNMQRNIMTCPCLASHLTYLRIFGTPAMAVQLRNAMVAVYRRTDLSNLALWLHLVNKDIYKWSINFDIHRSSRWIISKCWAYH